MELVLEVPFSDGTLAITKAHIFLMMLGEESISSENRHLVHI